MPDPKSKNSEDEKREVKVVFLSSTSLNDEELAEDGAEEEDCRNSNGSNREKDPLWAEAGVSSAAAAQHRAGSDCNVLNDH